MRLSVRILATTMRKLSHGEILENRHSVAAMELVQRFPIILLLNNIRSMHNIGSMFRTADAACIERIILTGYTAKPPREEISKTALGATETVPWTYEADAIAAITALKTQHIPVLALEQTTESRSIYDAAIAPDKPICVVVGNEVFGIDDDVLAACDGALEIPMHGMKHSLNVGVAAGVALFELVRRMALLGSSTSSG